jgi:tRNA (guanine-N7-)-methyltransferase
MGYKKLVRFEAIKSFGNVLEYPQGMAGAWHKHFGNTHPIVLELACGKGEYTLGLAQMYPHKNFIGVDIKGNRIYVGAKKALESGLNNAAFLRTQIGMLTQYFAAGEISEIWLTFPDPQLRGAKIKKRLTHPQFLQLYQQVMLPNGLVHLKTDSPKLFRFTQMVTELYALPLVTMLEDVHNLHPTPELSIKTHYEGLDIAGSNQIFYLQFKMTHSANFANPLLAKALKEAEPALPTT